MVAAITGGTQAFPIVLALAAAVCIGLGMALEHRGATRARPRPSVHPGLVLDLLRSSPAWRAGLLLTVAGYGLQAAAFGTGRLVIVEPLLTLALVVSLAASGLLSHRPLTHAQWLAAVATAGAVVVFTAVATPAAGRATAPVGAWAPWLGGVGGALALVAVVSPRWTARWRAGALAACAGCAFGISDALTKSVAVGIGRGGWEVLAHWFPYALAGVGVAAFLAQQTAYQAGRLADAQPALSVSEPLVGSVIGVTVLREHVHGSPVATAAVAVAVVVMAAGVIALGRLADRALPVPGLPLAGGPVRAPDPDGDSAGDSAGGGAGDARGGPLQPASAASAAPPPRPDPAAAAGPPGRDTAPGTADRAPTWADRLAARLGPLAFILPTRRRRVPFTTRP